MLENEKVVLEKKMWEKCGVQNQKNGVWAWCLIIPFVVLKPPFCGVKNGCQNSGGVEDVKNEPTSPNIWEVNAQEEPNCSHHYLLQCSIATT